MSKDQSVVLVAICIVAAILTLMLCVLLFDWAKGRRRVEYERGMRVKMQMGPPQLTEKDMPVLQSFESAAQSTLGGHSHVFSTVRPMPVPMPLTSHRSATPQTIPSPKSVRFAQTSQNERLASIQQ